MHPFPSRLLVAVLSAVALAACGASPQPTYIASNSVPPPRTLAIQSAARLDVAPDEACAQLTFSRTAPSVEQADGGLREQVTAFLAELDGFRDVRVSRGLVQLSPQMRRDADGNETRIGFTATHELHVKSGNFARIPEVLTHAAAHGVTNIVVRHDSTHLPERKAELRQRAAHAAREKADQLAHELGVRVVEVLSVEEDPTTTHGSAYQVANFFVDNTAGSDAPGGVALPGAIPLSMTLRITFRIE